MLTGLGIVISIASVIIVISAAQGVKGFIIGQFASYGSNIINTEVKVPSTGKNSSENAQAQSLGTVVTTLKLDDMKAINKLPNIVTSYAFQMGQAVAVSPTAKKTINILGTSATYLDIDTGKIGSGRFFTEAEDDSQARVVILGSEAARDLFGEADSIGQSIKIKQREFKVIGVAAPRGTTMFINYDVFAFVPVQTLQKQILGIDYITSVVSQYGDETKLKTTVADVEALMRQRHYIDLDNPDKDDFAVQTMDEFIKILDTIIGGFTILLILLAGISLVVGGVGIMNIMYVSVLERTFEIGLRKAVGATRQQILSQFLAEAVMVTFMGGLTGIILGAAVSYGIAVAAKLFGFAWAFLVPVYSIVLATGFSVACGLIFGLYPARRAADLDPIEALSKE
ncbi:MAG: ABC transporter permease [Candidatus Kerfeldbacteria bacterium]|nr:ABC transporter permease [Candidatus Kerfeldbacteria bacterium]